MSGPRGIVLDDNGRILVSDVGLNAVVRIDPLTGDRTIVSKPFVAGSGPGFDVLQGIALQADGSILVADSTLDAIVHVDPISGDRIRPKHI